MWIARVAPALASLALALGPARAQPVFRGRIDVVHTGVTVTDRKGSLVTGLTADDFDVYEDGQRQMVQYFAAGDASGDGASDLHLGVLLDVSESMSATIAFTRTAAIKFLNTLVDAVDVTLVDFGSEVRVTRYGQGDFPRLVERIREQKVSGWTALYDAIGVYLDGASAQDGRTIMLLYTDGGDTRSALRLNELMDLLRASDVTVYAIAAPDLSSGTQKALMAMLLRQITEVTGGTAFFPTTVGDLDKVYGRVLAEIRAQYTLGYVSTNGRADGAWRKVEIKLREPRNRRVRSRQGYYAPLRH